jgi:hypothetical protein
MKVTELKAAAEAASVLDHNENAGWYTAEYIEFEGAYYPKNARFIALANPATILKLIAVVEAAQNLVGQEGDYLMNKVRRLSDVLKELET